MLGAGPLIKASWPFFKEMIIGKNSLRYAIRKNRIRVAFFGCVMISFIINWYAVPRLFYITNKYIHLEKELKATRETIESYKYDKNSIDTTNKEIEALKAKVKEYEDKVPLTNGDGKSDTVNKAQIKKHLFD